MASRDDCDESFQEDEVDRENIRSNLPHDLGRWES
jgi:hypothetical protein